MQSDRFRDTYDPKISPPGAGPRVACAPTGASPGAPLGSAPTGASGAAPTSDAPPPSAAFRDVSTLIAEYKEYVAYYLSTKIDGLKVTARNVGVFSVLGIVGLIAGSAFITTAAVLVLAGAALGLGRLFSPVDDPYKYLWAGALLVGILFFATIAIATIVGLKKLTASSKKALVQKYEQRQNWERGQFGHNVRERAAQAK